VTGDELLQAAVKTGKAYQAIAADILKRAMESITEKERQDYKAYTLAMGYGGSADVLVKAMAKQGIDMPREEAEKIVQSYLRTYKGVAEARRKAKLHCKRSLPLRVKLATGLSRLYRSDQVDGGRAANSLLATRVSGLAAAGLKVGILLAHDQGLDRYLVNLVHDEVVLRCQLSQARALRDAMSACIIEGTKRVCPGAHVAVERHIGPSWDKKERFPAEVFTYEETDQ
jgi:DNA polymerase I-like protein with 3'-5' exonuclease and polymerase domains